MKPLTQPRFRLFVGTKRLLCACLLQLVLFKGARLSAQGIYDFVYVMDAGNEEVYIVDYSGPGGVVSIPESIEGKPVTRIEVGAFPGPNNMTAVTIPDTVTSIGEFAFQSCFSLRTVSLGNGVASIGEGAFQGCSNLIAFEAGPQNPAFGTLDGVLFNKSYERLVRFPPRKSGDYSVPHGVTEITNFAFSDCAFLTNLTIPDTVMTIGIATFFGCSGLVDVNIPDSVTRIGDSAFVECGNLRSVVIPDSVTSIEPLTYRGCSSLQNVSIGNGVTSIGRRAFFGCLSLETLTIGDSVGSIGEEAFADCESLTEVTFSDSLTSIGQAAFQGCTNLKSATLANGVTSIGTEAFQWCASLTSISIPGSVTSIGDRAFEGSSSLISAVIQDGVSSIGYGAFSGCSGLTAITLPTSLTSISQETFESCASLANVVIPDSVTSINSAAFSGCSSLAAVTIPDSVTSIGDRAFADCTSLTTIMISRNLVGLGWGAFQGCSGLMAIEVDPQNPVFSSPEGVLFTKGRDELIRFPQGKPGSYEIPEGVTRIGPTAFSGCTDLTEITIPDSVTSIGYYAFAYCTGLTSIFLPASVTDLGSDEEVFLSPVFAYCTSLSAIEVDSMNPAYSSLEGVLFNKDRTRLIQCPGAKAGDYSVPEGVINISAEAFAGCASLNTVVIPSSASYIGNGAFSNDMSLSGVYFDGNAPFAGFDIFESCPGVVVYYRTETTGWEATFAGRPTALWIAPPLYTEWLPTSGLPTLYPNGTSEADDPDQDGLDNYAEMLAGTDPTDRASVLVLEIEARPEDLIEEDRGAIGEFQHAVYVRSVPGNSYAVQWADSVLGPWHSDIVRTAATGQLRFVFDMPAGTRTYRAILVR